MLRQKAVLLLPAVLGSNAAHCCGQAESCCENGALTEKIQLLTEDFEGPPIEFVNTLLVAIHCLLDSSRLKVGRRTGLVPVLLLVVFSLLKLGHEHYIYYCLMT